MTGEPGTGWSLQRRAAWVPAVLALGALAACGGEGPGRRSSDAAQQASADDAPSTPVETDMEAPEVFQVTDRGLWDGRPSLGGVWVAHPDVVDPERVSIRNQDNGKFVIGALFRRERDNPGPPIQVSSEAAEALGLLAGAPAVLEVTALRREAAADPGRAPSATANVDGTAAEPDGSPDAPAPEAGASPDVAAAASLDPSAEAVSRATATILGGAPLPSMPSAAP